MATERNPFDGADYEPALVSSRLLMIPAFVVVCMTVFGVLHALSSTVAKPERPGDTRPVVPVEKKVGAGAGEIEVHRASTRHEHVSIPRFLPGEPTVLHQS